LRKKDTPISAGGSAPLNPEDCADGWKQACGGALRVDNYKIIVGYPVRKTPFLSHVYVKTVHFTKTGSGQT
jgi:hypothetical protein